MPITKFPNGVSSFGLPVLGTGRHITTGSVFFVHASTGSNGNSGADPDHPFATIDYAIGQCTADKGDIIYVMPGHTETMTTAAHIDADVQGISIIGIGNGRTRPIISVSTSAGVDFDIDADSITVENMVFDLTGVDAVAGFFDVNEADFTLRDCEIIMADTAGQATSAMQCTSAHRMLVENCVFYAPDAGANEAIELGDACSNVRVIGNLFDGDFAVGAIYTADTPTNLLIKGNVIRQISAGIAGITLGATGTASTGIVCDNRISVADTASYTAQTVTQIGDVVWFENYLGVSGWASEAAIFAPAATYGT